ncbi:MAG: hypothetical protein MI810_20130 [Flavobacteriales bacterium]|nr:hypothetical protein [Flavobacteriales bacterium]
MKRLRQLFERLTTSERDNSFFDRDLGGYAKPSDKAKASILLVLGFIILIPLILFIIWLDNYIRYHF